MKPIPQEWIKNYVDQLIDAAQLFEEGTAMRDGALVRADAVLDMVKAFREDSCEHEFVDARNERVRSGEVCVKCGRIRATNANPPSAPE